MCIVFDRAAAAAGGSEPAAVAHSSEPGGAFGPANLSRTTNSRAKMA